MNQQGKQEPNTQPSIIEDLTVGEDVTRDVKGGPIYMDYIDIKGDVSAAGNDILATYDLKPLKK